MKQFLEEYGETIFFFILAVVIVEGYRVLTGLSVF